MNFGVELPQWRQYKHPNYRAYPRAFFDSITLVPKILTDTNRRHDTDSNYQAHC